ncbi:glycosyltransferase family 1 protein [Priestia endophytica]
MIRVLHVVGSMNIGGIETFLMNVYRNIDRTKVQFDFAVHTRKEGAYDEEIKKLGGRIFHIAPRSRNILRNSKDWHTLFREHPEIQIVHQHVSSLTYVNPLKVALRNNVKARIVHSHSIEAEGKIHYLLHCLHSRKINKYANKYFSCSDLSSRWLFGKSKVDYSEIVTINNAIDIDKFTYNKDKQKLSRKNLNIDDEFVIGHVGRFAEVKNHKFLVDIFSDIIQKIGKAKLVLVGEGNLKNDIHEYVKIKGLENHVLFVGGSSNVGDIMQAMDAFVFPSLYEGLGMVLIEAQAAGLKCFTSKDVVPQEVNISKLIKYIPLSEDSEVWSNYIIKSVYDTERPNTASLLKESGFEIKEVAKELQDRYLAYLQMES